ncbi:MAG TPA: carboxypeptidase regulatory-like domain-containing protein [Saprospiraceae bacterium]|nr:carboxypeptidase regulatory-like domain-containing protein [Saprospiraceae bacterium]HMQ84933.1 carboxypeptidase regulatory-like domain-containing protein [Saprospiraceae bacterium]
MKKYLSFLFIALFAFSLQAQTATLAGSVYSPNGNSYENVTVNLLDENGSWLQGTNTTNDGAYQFNNLPIGASYTIQLEVENNFLQETVSTFDIVLISRHILGLVPLDSPFKILAADATQSQTLTVSDMIDIRKYVLGITNTLTQGFGIQYYQTNIQFNAPSNPFAGYSGGSPTIQLDEDTFDFDFYLFKTGDVSF